MARITVKKGDMKFVVKIELVRCTNVRFHLLTEIVWLDVILISTMPVDNIETGLSWPFSMSTLLYRYITTQAA